MTSMPTARTKYFLKGFTLLELIVSIGLFTIVVTIAMSAYLALISLDRKARATNDLVTNLSFVVESMSHDIRTGTGYTCGGVGHGPNCWGAGGSTILSYTNEQNNLVTYLLTAAGTVGECVGPSPCNDSTATVLTDPRIRVTNLTFYVDGVGTTVPYNTVQPRVMFTLTGTITPDNRSAPTTFTIESMATERLIEL
jgi:prepilin-type N-terminal cleavage/methylation domain-containing protein